MPKEYQFRISEDVAVPLRKLAKLHRRRPSLEAEMAIMAHLNTYNTIGATPHQAHIVLDEALLARQRRNQPRKRK